MRFVSFCLDSNDGVCFQKENVPGDLRIWSSQKIRAAQTANYLKELAAHVEYWKVLDEIDAGICEGLTYEDFQARYPKQFAERDKDKYHYRYPSGEVRVFKFSSLLISFCRVMKIS